MILRGLCKDGGLICIVTNLGGLYAGSSNTVTGITETSLVKLRNKPDTRLRHSYFTILASKLPEVQVERAI